MRLFPVFAILLAVAPRLAAQEPTFLFSTDTRDVVTIGDLKGSPNITVRPNTARELNLFVCNRALDPHDLRVQLLDATGKVIATSEVKKAEKKSYTRVKFAKPAPPSAVQKSMPAAPPGIELMGAVGPTRSLTFGFRLRLIDDTAIDTAWERAKATPEGKDKTRDEVAAALIKTDAVVVSVLDSAKYIVPEGQLKYKNFGGENLLELTLRADQSFTGPPCLVEMVFPPQPNLDVAAMGAGVYRKTISEPGQSVALYASGLPLRAGNLDVNEIVYLNIDGVPRVYTFRPNLRLERRDLTDVVEPVDAAIRLVEDGKKEPPAAFVAQPKEHYPVRVEIDNSVSPFVLELTKMNGEVLTKVTRPTARHEQVWVDPATEGGAFRITSRVADWFVPLDTREMRGQFTLTATLTDARRTVKGEDRPVTFSRPLILDDTPPPADRIRIDTFPEKQFRGRPMNLTVLASDPESPIAKVVAFFGRPAPDGKRPEGVSPAEATMPSIAGAGWNVELPVPADKKLGDDEISFAVTNAVGLTSTKTIKVRWIAPQREPAARNQRKDGPAAIPAPQEKKEPDPGVKVPVPIPLPQGDVIPVPLPVGAKKGGKEDVTVIVTNAVGLAAARVIEIQLLDSPTVGTITGMVTAGESGRGRASTTVILRDADGKEKGATRTNPKGQYEFLQVAAGTYTVTAAKSGSGAGTAGAQVTVGETATANVVLVRKP